MKRQSLQLRPLFCPDHRNDLSGVSHSPEEHVVDEDAQTGAQTLADALQGLMV